MEITIGTYWDEATQTVDFFAVWHRDETDLERDRRVATDRRRLVTSVALAERKKAREIKMLKEQAAKHGFVLATKVGD